MGNIRAEAACEVEVFSMRLYISIFNVFLFALSPLIAGNEKDTEAADADVVVAEIDGTRITLGEFKHVRSNALFQARNSFYEAEHKALEEFIDDYLLKKEAQRENLSVEQLLQRHVNGAVPKDPSEEALRVYYEGVDTKEPYEAVRDKILEHLRQRRLEKARTTYLRSLRSHAAVIIRLSPPRADIALNEAARRGPQHASVLLVEYADYECLFCQQIEPELQKLQQRYHGSVAVVYKDVPLPMHMHAEKAAEAARCAGAQGKFWDYHDLLFSSKALGAKDLKQHSRSLSLDAAAFDKCLDSGEQAPKVMADLSEAQKLGLAGTPTFFINGRLLGSGVTYESLQRQIEQELASAESGQQQTASR